MSLYRRGEGYRYIRDRDFEKRISRARRKEGTIAIVAKKKVVTATPTAPIMGVAKQMIEHKFRRMPITRPGSNQLIGIVTLMDMVDYFGGGTKFQVVVKRYQGNFFKAANAPVELIMRENPPRITIYDDVEDAVELMLEEKVGVLPVVNEEEKVVGIITEGDIVRFFAGKISGTKVGDVMSRNVCYIRDNVTIRTVMQVMVSSGFRRLPIVDENKKPVGMASAFSVLKLITSKEAVGFMQMGKLSELLERSVKLVTSEEIIGIGPDADLGEAATVMFKNKADCLLVQENGELVGILTERDLLRSLAS